MAYFEVIYWDSGHWNAHDVCRLFCATLALPERTRLRPLPEKTTLGRTPKRSDSLRERSRHLVEIAFSEPLLEIAFSKPLLRTLLRIPSEKGYPFLL